MNLKRSTIAIMSVATLTASIYSGVSYMIEAKTQTPPEAEMLEDVDSDTAFKRESDVEELYTKAMADDIKSKFDSVKGINSDIVGWVFIPDSNVDYPICSGNDDYYLNYTYDRKKSAAGSIFLDERLLNFSNISMLHGHNMRNGTMFSSLKRYKDQTYFNNTNVYIYDGENIRVFKPIGFTKVPQEMNYDLSIKDGPLIQEYAQEITSNSIHKTSKEITQDDLLILNTCVSDGTNQHYILITQEIFGGNSNADE